MKTILKISAVLICLIFLAATCKQEGCHDTIRIVNNSDKPIYYDPSYRYPDTLLVDNHISGNDYKKVLNHSAGKIMNRDCFDGEISGSRGGKIMIYIFDASTYETTPWDTIVKYNMILKRYDLTELDLDNMNWTITYP